MGKDTENVLGIPTIILMGVGAISSAILFYLMFKFADDGNLLMVLITASLIAVISFGIVKGLVSISKHEYSKWTTRELKLAGFLPYSLNFCSQVSELIPSFWRVIFQLGFDLAKGFFRYWFALFPSHFFYIRDSLYFQNFPKLIRVIFKELGFM